MTVKGSGGKAPPFQNLFPQPELFTEAGTGYSSSLLETFPIAEESFQSLSPLPLLTQPFPAAGAFPLQQGKTLAVGHYTAKNNVDK